MGSGFITKQARSDESARMFRWALRNTNTYEIAKENEPKFKFKTWLGKENFVEGIVKEDIYITIFKKELKNFFHWVKGAELVDLDECDTSEDPVRPELDNKFRTGYGRKIFGVEYGKEATSVSSSSGYRVLAFPNLSFFIVLVVLSIKNKYLINSCSNFGRYHITRILLL